MNSVITDHLDQLINSISPAMRKFKFTYRRGDHKQEITCSGENAKDARRSFSYYCPGDVEVLGCKELFE